MKEKYSGTLHYTPLAGWCVIFVAKVNGKIKVYLLRITKKSHIHKKLFSEGKKLKFFLYGVKAGLVL